MHTDRTVDASVSDGHCTVVLSRAIPAAWASSKGTISTELTCAR